MKNIKISFFCVMTIITSMFCIAEELIAAKEALSAFAMIQDLVFTSEDHRENQQWFQENRQFAREDHEESQRVAQENRQFTKENHEQGQWVAMEKQWLFREQQRLALLANNSNVETQLILNQQKIAQAQVEKKRIEAALEKEEAENAFRRCLIKHRRSFDLETSGLPKECHDVAAVFALYNSYSALEEEIVDYNKVRELLHHKK